MTSKFDIFKYANWVLMAAFVIYVAMISYQLGDHNGFERRSKLQDELDCTTKYNDKPINEVPADCYRYYVEEVK